MTKLTSHYLDNIRYSFIFLLGLSIPFSTAATNIVVGLMVILLITELLLIPNENQQKWLLLRHNPIVWLAIALFSFMLIAISYTSVDWSEISKMLLKYRELLFIPLFILLIRDKKSQQFGLSGFLLGMAITLFLSYLISWTGWSIGKGTADNPFVFKNHITQGILMSLATYFLAVQSFQNHRWRWLRVSFVLLAMYNIIFMTQGRTGYLILACLILLFIYQIYQWRGLLIGIVALSLTGLVIYHSANSLQHRVDKVFDNITAYEQGQHETSIGFRLEFYKNSGQLVTQHPILGTGTGSFHHTYADFATARGMVTTENPHNEYLMIAVQWGIVGLSLWIALLYIAWQRSYMLDNEKKWMLQGLIVTMVVGCLVNSLLLDFTEGHAFVFLLSIFLSESRLTGLKDLQDYPENPKIL